MIIQEDGEGRLNRSIPGRMLRSMWKPTQPGDSKLCVKCQRVLPKTNFYTAKRKTGRFCISYCKECYRFYVNQINKRKKKKPKQ